MHGSQVTVTVTRGAQAGHARRYKDASQKEKAACQLAAMATQQKGAAQHMNRCAGQALQQSTSSVDAGSCMAV